jgi:micrococcal nuclease
MKKSAAWLILAGVLAGLWWSGNLPSGPWSPPPLRAVGEPRESATLGRAAGETGTAREEARVVFVADGDTVRCVYRGRLEWVRLLRINTPEKDRRGYSGARALLRRLVEKKTVLLEFEDPGRPERDQYGRLLGYLFREEVNVNVEMVRAGWSRFWKKYGEGRYAAEFRQAESEARGAGRGLWAQ